MGRKLEAAKELLETGLGSLTLKQIRSLGTKKKINPNQVKIGAVKSGLYYDKDLPFIHKIPSVQASGKHKGKKDTKYRLRSQGPEDLITVHFWEGGKQVFKPMKRKDLRPVKDPKTGKTVYRRHESDERRIKKEKITIPLLKRIVANPGEFGLKGTMKNTKDILPIVNKELVKSGYKPVNQHTLNIDLFKVQGKQRADIFKGSDREKEFHSFLREINPKTGKPRFNTIVVSEIKADPRFKDLSGGVIKESRLRGKLNRPVEPGYKESPLENAQRRIKNKLKEKYPDMIKEEIAAYNEQARILLYAPEHSANFSKRLYNERYTDEDLDTVIRFIEKTDMPLFRSGQHPEMEKYMTERAINQLRSALSGETYTMGHTRRRAGDTWWLSGLEDATMSPQKGDINLAHLHLDNQFQAAIKRGDMKTAEEAYRKMVQKGIRSSMVDEFGEQIFYGSPPIKGKMAEGGIVNGYSRGGKVKNLLDDAIGMMSRRKFMKGMGATAASTAMPKGLLKAVSPTLSKGAMNFAPPWVNNMLSSLKSVKDLGALGQRRSVMGGGMSTGNDAKIINLGTKNIKVYKDQEAKITSFKIKTADEKAADDIANSQGVMPRSWWDDVELREEPGQKTITFKNKEYDGNDQHIVIDTKNKETRFVDDNWRMEAGGEDIAKDDWIEWAITPNKNEIKVALKKPLSEIDDAIVDGYSVNDMEDYGMDSYVDSFSPSGNIFGTVERMVKKMKKKDMSRQEKKLNDESREKNMMEWEGQFRGGQGIHGYSHGGVANTRDRVGEFFNPPNYRQLPAQANNWLALQGNDKWEGLSKDQSRHEKTLSFDNPQSGIRAAIISLASRAARTNKSPNLSLNQIFFEDSPWAENQGAYRQYFKDLNLPTNTIYDMSNRESVSSLINTIATLEMGNEDYNSLDSGRRDHIINQGIDMAYKRLIDPDYGYYSIYENKFAEGGIARRPNAVPPEKGPDPYGTLIDDSVSQIMNNPSEFMGTQFIQKFSKGGFVKKNAPKVIGMLTNYKPKLTMSPGLKKAQPKMAGKRIIEEETVEQPGAMFWGSREKIIGAPSEAMTGTQWLQYMKIGKHGILNPKGFPVIKDMELNDTSLAPWLSRIGNKTLSKEKLVKQFDEMSPTMEVTALGEDTAHTSVRIMEDISKSLKSVDTQAIRNPQIKGFYDYMKAVMPQLKESTTNDAAKGIVKGIDDMVFNNFGVKDALAEGVPQRFPFEIKGILQSLSTALGKRTAGFKTYKRSPQHRGTQMMQGGDNYREFLFKAKPGSLRQNEPEYKYAHDFNLSSADRTGGVVHTRTSDRTDEFGRRLLNIEEIQSDMHQKINAAQRKVKKQIAEWEKQGLKPHEAYLKLSTRQRKEFDELTAASKYAPRGDLKEEIGTANEQHFALVKAKIEDLLAQPQTKQTVTRLTKLKKERTKIRKMIEEEKAKMAEGSHSGVPQGPLSKTEDYNEFVMKYMLRVAREGGYDGITINTPAIKNIGMSPTNKDYKGNLVAYGPMAKGAMEKAAKKSGAKFMKTYIKDGNGRVWEVPMLLIKENKAAQAIIDKGLPVYKRGGVVKK